MAIAVIITKISILKIYLQLCKFFGNYLCDKSLFYDMKIIIKEEHIIMYDK